MSEVAASPSISGRSLDHPTEPFAIGPPRMRLRLAVQPIYAAPGTLEATINVAEQNTASLRCYGSKIARPA